ncbi:DUF1275 family protein, partial [Saccharomonospora iraqiensis]|uniref:DUF1275 family protein n=1 Tax=Saccharomonospora iraqiensis TaxID=52698 RepID=UPI00047C9822
MTTAPPPRRTVVALLVLTLVTGIVDAVSFLRLDQIFVANMTGNVVFLGLSVTPSSSVAAYAPAIAIAGFTLGALAGGVFAARAPAGAVPGHRTAA